MILHLPFLKGQKNMKRIFTIFLVAAMLTACAETPENILKKEYVNNSDAQSSTMLDGEPEITSLVEMNASKSNYIEQIKALELDNMTFNENLTADIPAEVKTGSFICPTGFQDNYVELFTHYDEDFDEKNVVFDESSYPTGPIYTNPDKNLEMSIGCTGFFSYYNDFDDDYKIFYESEFIKTYTVSEAQSSDEAFMLMDSDREISVSEALEKAQLFADDFTALCDYPNEIYVVRINLFECEDGFFYKIDYSQSVSDSGILEYHSRYNDIDEHMVEPGVYAHICGNEVNSFVVNSSFNEHEITGTLTETIDMKYAAEYLSGALAGKMNLDVKRIAFEYCMIYTDNIEEKTDGKETDREKAPWATYCSYDLYKAEPCWVFYFDETPDKEIYAILHCDDMSVNFVNNQR